MKAAGPSCPGNRYGDAWRWDTAEQMLAAQPAARLPEAIAAMSLVRDATAMNDRTSMMPAVSLKGDW